MIENGKEMIRQAKISQKNRSADIVLPGHKKGNSTQIQIQNRKLYNTDMAKVIEDPSVSCIASARGLAKLASSMANKGKFRGKEIMTEIGWE